ncbi:hypothetical protein B484DRAFT_416296, partial [Ochromonadaceae sp. CCMP2298]
MPENTVGALLATITKDAKTQARLGTQLCMSASLDSLDLSFDSPAKMPSKAARYGTPSTTPSNASQLLGSRDSRDAGGGHGGLGMGFPEGPTGVTGGAGGAGGFTRSSSYSTQGSRGGTGHGGTGGTGGTGGMSGSRASIEPTTKGARPRVVQVSFNAHGNQQL